MQAVLADGAGFSVAEELARRHPGVVFIALTSQPYRVGTSARAWVEKGNPRWSMQVVSHLRSHLPTGLSVEPLRPYDVFAGLTADELERFRGKVLLIAGQPARVVASADSLQVAERLAAGMSDTRTAIRFVQGPPVQPMSLAELEGR